MSRIACIVAMLSVLVACKEKQPIEEIEFGFDYLPLKVGSYIDYDVDSVVYDDFNETVVTYSFILRETVAETFRDAEGRTAFRIERSKRHADSLYFDVINSYSVLIDGVRAERVFDNKREVVLIFPPKANSEWDGNVYNTSQEEDFTYDYVDKVGSYDALTFDSTLRVIQVNDTDNFVIKSYSEERYAKGVGLIYKEYFDIERNFEIDSGLHWIQIIRSTSI